MHFAGIAVTHIIQKCPDPVKKFVILAKASADTSLSQAPRVGGPSGDISA
jgi:hypothetical protein